MIKNNTDDLKVLVRAFNEYDHISYREINLDILGKLPEFECVTQKENVPEAIMEQAEDPERFSLTREERKRKKRKSPKKVTKEKIFERISRFINGFEVDPEESSEEDSSDGEQEVEPTEMNIETNV